MSSREKSKTPRAPSGNPELGARIKEFLRVKGFTQRRMEAVTGIPQSNLSALISGKHLIGDDRLQLIADALGITLEELVGDTVKRQVLVSPGRRGPARPPPTSWEMHPFPERLPQGLEHYFRGHIASDKITKREQFYLANSRFKAEPWVEFNDDFWGKQLEFWRTYLKEQDAAGAQPPPSEEEPD